MMNHILDISVNTLHMYSFSLTLTMPNCTCEVKCVVVRIYVCALEQRKMMKGHVLGSEHCVNLDDVHGLHLLYVHVSLA